MINESRTKRKRKSEIKEKRAKKGVKEIIKKW